MNVVGLHKIRFLSFGHIFSSICILILALILSSCATNQSKLPPPVSSCVRLGITCEEEIPKIEKVALFNDVCLEKDAVLSDDYFSINDSKLAESYMLGSAKNYLVKKGYKIEYSGCPFVGAFKSPGLEFKVAENDDAPVKDINPPFYDAGEIQNDFEFKQCVIKAENQILKAVEKSDNDYHILVSLDETDIKCLNLISERTNSEAAMFIFGNGRCVPGGKSFAEAMTTGMITGIATMGMVTYSHWETSYLDTYVGFVDLKNGKLLWSNSTRHKSIDPTDQDYYEKENGWARINLYFVPEKK